MRHSRLSSQIFDLPIQEIRRGYRSDIYFWREKITLERNKLHPTVTMQVFQKKKALFCGIDEALAILKIGSGYYKNEIKAYKLFDRFIDLKRSERKYFHIDPEKYINIIKEKTGVSQELDSLWEDAYPSLKIEALYDGDSITPWESVMHISGDASSFAHLETVYLGVLARRTRIATNVRNVVNAAKGKTILYFPARFDHWAIQGGDGYAAYIGGATSVSTDAQAEWWGAKGGGTVPHALIAALGGSTVSAIKMFSETYKDTNLVALVDFENDCIKTALECAHELKGKLWGVRLDTSENMVDKSIVPMMSNFKPTGVVPELVYRVRKALDREGFGSVKIIVSGGFTPDKITEFEEHKVPVDAYGVGSYFMQGAYDFTADIVLLDNKHCAKEGRKFILNERLETVI